MVSYSLFRNCAFILSVFFGFFCVKMVTENQQKFEKEKREIEQSHHTQVINIKIKLNYAFL